MAQHHVLVSLLALACVFVSANCQRACWSNKIENTNVAGGTGNNAQDVAACQVACENDAQCRGVDWNTLLPTGEQCFLNRQGSGPRTNGTANNIDHYDLNRGCLAPTTTPSGGSCWSTAFENTNVNGGEPNGAADENACRMACQQNTECRGIDWAAGNTETKCWLILNDNPKGTRNGVKHYDYNRNCQGTATMTGGSTTPSGGTCWSAPIANSNVDGGSKRTSINDLAGCQQACVSDSQCRGVDWNPNNADSKCWLTLNDNQINSNRPGVTHYTYDRNCQPGTCWSAPIANSNVDGGSKRPAIADLGGCQQACVSESECRGIDWNPNNQESKCWLSLSDGTVNSNRPGITHYNYDRTCQPGGTASTTPSTALCGWSAPIANTNVNGGSEVTGIADEAACRDTCKNDANCIGIDWVITGKKCYTIPTGKTQTSPKTGVTHWNYDRGATCATATPSAELCGWSAPIADTNVNGGSEVTGVADEAACRDTCKNDANCIGIDWAIADKKCFTIPTGKTQTSTKTGVTHWNYDRAATCATTSPELCGWGAAVANTNVDGGKSNDAADIAACREACKADATCIAINWAPSDTKKCFLVPTGKTDKKTKTGVTHYDYDRTANCPGVTPGPPLCGWGDPMADTNVNGGKKNGANDLPACQKACQDDSDCIGVDWAPGNADGDKCYLTPSSKTETNTKPGVTHYTYDRDICPDCVDTTWSPHQADTRVLGSKKKKVPTATLR